MISLRKDTNIFIICKIQNIFRRATASKIPIDGMHGNHQL